MVEICSKLTPRGTSAHFALVFPKFSISSSPRARARVFSSAKRGGATLSIIESAAFVKIPPTRWDISSCENILEATLIISSFNMKPKFSLSLFYYNYFILSIILVVDLPSTKSINSTQPLFFKITSASGNVFNV